MLSIEVFQAKAPGIFSVQVGESDWTAWIDTIVSHRS